MVSPRRSPPRSPSSGSWPHRDATGFPLPDLLIAACAQQHAAGVLHVDRHFETLTDVLAFDAVGAD